MVDILQTTFAFFVRKINCIFIYISLIFIPKGPIDIKPAFVQIMAWHRTSAKPLPEPMMAQFTDALASLGLSELRYINR